MTTSLLVPQPSATEPAPDYRDPAVRLAQLLDRGTMVSLYKPDTSGVLVVRGRIDGSEVFAYCTDGTRMGGALGAAGCNQIVGAIDAAIRAYLPIIGIWHSGGAELREGIAALDAVGRVFAAMTRASGRVAQISVVVGPAAGGAAYGPALTDVVVMADAGRIFVTRPDVVRSVTGEKVGMDELGGADAHGTKSGVVHVIAKSEADAYARARSITALLARQGSFDRTGGAADIDPSLLLPSARARAYDIRPVIKAILDRDPKDSSFEELQPRWAMNICIGFGRLGGRTIGVVANNPLRKGGCLDSLSAEKSARFVRTCDALGVPLLVLADVPGYLPGLDQEWDGVVRRGAKLLHAFADAVVPRVTLIIRKAYGGAFIAMNSRALGATRVLAWPKAEVAVMGADAAVSIIHRRHLAATPQDERANVLRQLAEEHQRLTGGVERGLALGIIDEVIEPIKTRYKIIEALADAPHVRGRHGNIPL